MSVPPFGEKGYSHGTSNWWRVEDLEETPELRWPLSVDVFDRMRRQDAQVMSVLRAVMLPIRRTTWRVDPNGAKARVTKQIAEDLGLPILGQTPKPLPRQADRFSWQEHLRLALLMLVFGHSFFEQVYRLDGAGQVRLRKLGWRPPRTITRMDVARDGGLEAIYQADVLAAEGVKLPVNRLVAYVNDREGGAWIGQSLLRPAFKFWLLKDRSLRVAAQTIERNGLGVPIYTASEQPENVTGEERRRRQEEEMEAGADLAKAFRAGDNSGAAIPATAKLELRGVQGSLPPADPFIRYCDEQIARAVLANFLSLGGDNSTGSYALGETFADFFILSLQTVAGQVADVASQHIVEDLVDANFGPDEPAPRIVFDEIGSKHAATAEAVQLLLQAGAISADEGTEQFMRTAYGLPAADPSTRRTPPAPEPAPDPAADPAADPEQDTPPQEAP